LGLFNIKKFIL